MGVTCAIDKLPQRRARETNAQLWLASWSFQRWWQTPRAPCTSRCCPPGFGNTAWRQGWGFCLAPARHRCQRGAQKSWGSEERPGPQRGEHLAVGRYKLLPSLTHDWVQRWHQHSRVGSVASVLCYSLTGMCVHGPTHGQSMARGLYVNGYIRLTMSVKADVFMTGKTLQHDHWKWCDCWSSDHRRKLTLQSSKCLFCCDQWKVTESQGILAAPLSTTWCQVYTSLFLFTLFIFLFLILSLIFLSFFCCDSLWTKNSIPLTTNDRDVRRGETLYTEIPTAACLSFVPPSHKSYFRLSIMQSSSTCTFYYVHYVRFISLPLLKYRRYISILP